MKPGFGSGSVEGGTCPLPVQESLSMPSVPLVAAAEIAVVAVVEDDFVVVE